MVLRLRWGGDAMAWIRTVEESEATGAVAEVYRREKQRIGYVSNLWKAFGLHPAFLEAWDQVAKSAFFGGTSLGRRREEMIAVVVSSKLRCSY